jgi:murein L,D-transpeptidase YafK
MRQQLRKFLMALLALAAIAGLAGCQGNVSVDDFFPKAEKPLPPDLVKTMKAKGMTGSSPIMLRIFKTENVVEVWKQTDTGRYDLLKEYEICKWSGKLGPKYVEGDKQAPEGFYTINPWQMNPQSKYYLAFNLGFPNAFDKAHGRTGTHLMVHGACSSAGCYSMTDERMEEIFALAREAFEGGQKSFQVQAFPFKMTPQNMAEHQDDPNFEFWRMLKEGYDHFEITRVPPKIDVCDKRYVFNRLAEDEKSFKPQEACPATAVPDSLALAYGKYISKEDEVFQKTLKKKATKEAWAGKPAEPIVNTTLKPAEMPVPASQLAVLAGTGAGVSSIAVAGASAGSAATPASVPLPTPAPSQVEVKPQPTASTAAAD